MKKIILGSVAAICAAVGLSSFKTQTFLGPYYFEVNDGVNKEAGVYGQVLLNSQVTYISSIIFADCSGIGYECVVTFYTEDLTLGRENLRSGYQEVRDTYATRASD